MENSFSGKKPNKLEKPPFLYHGSVTPDIEEFEPRQRHTPFKDAGERIYASHLPAFAAAHSFPWSSNEGFLLSVQENKILFRVPKKFTDRLQVPVYIYKLPSDSFDFTSKEGTGSTFDSTRPVRPISSQGFNSVVEAVEYFGGEVKFIE